MRDIIIAGVVVVTVVYVVAAYNHFIEMIETIRNYQKQIDIQLGRRYKVFQALVEVTKKYMDYKLSVLQEVMVLHDQVQTAKEQGNLAAMMQVENRISRILSELRVLFEPHPDLLANQDVMQLREEIANIENKLALSKQALNVSIERYNVEKKSLLQVLIVKMFKNLDQNFTCWPLDVVK